MPSSVVRFGTTRRPGLLLASATPAHRSWPPGTDTGAPKGAAAMAPWQDPGIAVLAAVGTGGLQGWINDNIVPLLLLGLAIVMLWVGGRGDNAGVARRGVGLIVGLVALGIALTPGAGARVGQFFSGLITG